MKTTNHTKPRRVNYLEIAEDYEAAYLGSLGFSTRMIRKHTKLTDNQITYRLHKAEIRRMDYRNGESDTAALVLRSLRDIVETSLRRYLRKMSIPK